MTFYLTVVEVIISINFLNGIWIIICFKIFATFWIHTQIGIGWHIGNVSIAWAIIFAAFMVKLSIFSITLFSCITRHHQCVRISMMLITSVMFSFISFHASRFVTTIFSALFVMSSHSLLPELL